MVRINTKPQARTLLLRTLTLVGVVSNTCEGAIEIGANVPPASAAAINYWLAKGTLPDSLLVGVGNTTTTRECTDLITLQERAALPAEGYIVRSNPARTLLCCDGAPARKQPITNAAGHSVGAAYCGYAILQLLGMAFLHPLSPAVPALLVAPAEVVNETVIPGFVFRGFHVHTEHPLELLEALQGSDLVLPTTTTTAAGGNTIAWEDQLDLVASWMEWCVANRLNRIEWVLLTTQQWVQSGFVNSTPVKSLSSEAVFARGMMGEHGRQTTSLLAR
jgi:hypothetical protein